jgi:hypothetical protein
MSSHAGRIQIDAFENTVHEEIFKSENNTVNMQCINKVFVTYTGQNVSLRR